MTISELKVTCDIRKLLPSVLMTVCIKKPIMLACPINS